MGKRGTKEIRHASEYTKNQAYILRGYYLRYKGLSIEDVRYMLAIARLVVRKDYQRAKFVANKRGWDYIINNGEMGYNAKHILKIDGDEYALELFV